jgi:hypothetical protein
MLIIRPKTVDSTVLNYSNILETAPAAWSSGTTYAAETTVSIVSGSMATIYRSLQNANLNNNPATATDWWAPDGVTYLAWSSGTTYAAGDRIVDSATHHVFESLSATNLNHAITDLSWWVDIGPTNRWAMFDGLTDTKTTNPFHINAILEFDSRVDGIGFLGMENVGSVRVVVSTATDGVVYDKTFILISTDGIDNWYSYFFEEVGTLDTLIVTDLPAYPNPIIEVTLEGNGLGDAALGILTVGLSKNLGLTLHDNAQIGIVDYSKAEADEFGNFTLVKRNYSRRGTFQCMIENSALDGIYKVLTQYRATPALYSATDDFGSAQIYGIFQEFNIEIAYPNESLVSIDIKGLT